MAEITVWVNGREKRVTGVSRSTTCRDVVTLLLRDHLKSDEILPSYSQCFCLFERWRGCERVLSPRTRLYKLWKAWDHEQKNVRFTLKRSTSGGPHPEEIGDELIGQTGRKSTLAHKKIGKEPISPEDDNKKIRKSTVRPLKVRDQSQRNCAESASGGRSEEPNSETISRNRNASVVDLESLVHVVVKQSKRLQEFLEKIREIDVEIEFYETKAHLLRVEEKGKNYVQDAYLSRLGSNSSQSDDTEDNLCELMTNGCSDLETYISLYEKLLDVDSQLTAKRGAISELTETIERTRLRCRDDSNPSCTGESGSQTCSELVNGTSAPLGTNDEKCAAEHQRKVDLLRVQLEWHTDVCDAQKTEIATMQNRLSSNETLYNDKRHWLDILVTELDRLERDSPPDTTSSVEANNEVDTSQVRESVSITKCCDTKADGESKLDDGHDSGVCLSPDSSSDTGLSSLYSQDDTDNTTPVLAETLV